jgi:hypothetical protein
VTPDDEYVDPVAVERLMKGDIAPDAVRAQERAETIRRLRALGLGAAAIHTATGISVNTVTTALRGIRAPAGLGGRGGRPPKTTPPRCGSEYAYRRHIRLGEPVDDACRAAHNAKYHRDQQRRRERVAA